MKVKWFGLKEVKITWLEFYSGTKCIYTTEPISVDSKFLDFSFSVEGVEKLTIMRNATKDMNV